MLRDDRQAPLGSVAAIIDVRARRGAAKLWTREYEVVWTNGRSNRALEEVREWVVANDLKAWPARVGHVAALTHFLGAQAHIDVVEELQKLLALAKRCIAVRPGAASSSSAPAQLVAGALDLKLAQLHISEVGLLLHSLLVERVPVAHALSPLYAAVKDALRQLHWLGTEVEGATDAPAIIVGAVAQVAQRWGVDVATASEIESRDASAEPPAKKVKRGGDGSAVAAGALADADSDPPSSFEESGEPMTQAPDNPDYAAHGRGPLGLSSSSASSEASSAPSSSAAAVKSTGLDMESVCGHHANKRCVSFL